MKPSEIYSGHGHNFDVGIAYHLGLNAAVVFNHIVYWIRFNALKHENSYIDGKYWMYETQEAISNSLGYLTLEQVKKAVVDLVDHGLLIKGNYNKNKFDRTAWYTVHSQEIITIGLRNSKISFESAKNNNGERTKQLSIAELGAMYNIDTREETYKEQQQQRVAEPAQSYNCDSSAVVSSSEKFHQDQVKSYQAQSKPQTYEKTVQLKIHKCLEKVDIPDADKQEISKMYDADTVKNAIAWATDARNPPKVCIAASTKFACSRGLSDKDLKQSKKEDQKPAFDPYPFNKAYWRQIQSRIGRTNIRESNDYLELPNDKLYFKDRSFLEQISCYLRKIGALPEIFQLIKQCQQDLNNQ